MEYNNLNNRDHMNEEQMILDALVLLDPRGHDKVVDESIEIVKQAFVAASRNEQISGYEILQRAKWQLATSSERETL